MLKAVSALSKKYDVPCEISVEVPMACGFGACIGCAVKVKDRFAIACVEGPVFQAKELVWD
jgi:dihydroorotate dehydrogenase electron transfer subunit